MQVTEYGKQNGKEVIWNEQVSTRELVGSLLGMLLSGVRVVYFLLWLCVETSWDGREVQAGSLGLYLSNEILTRHVCVLGAKIAESVGLWSISRCRHFPLFSAQASQTLPRALRVAVTNDAITGTAVRCMSHTSLGYYTASYFRGNE